MIKIGQAGIAANGSILTGHGLEMRSDSIGRKLARAMDQVAEGRGEQISRTAPAGQALQCRVEMQCAPQHEFAGAVARILRIYEAEMDLAFVPQARLRDGLRGPIEQLDAATARGQSQGDACALDSRSQDRNCLP